MLIYVFKRHFIDSDFEIRMYPKVATFIGMDIVDNINKHFRAHGHELICSKNHFSKIHHHSTVNISWCIHMNEK